MERPVDWRIGLVGFAFPEWLKTLYAERKGTEHLLSVYSRHFNAVEINTTFHALPARETVRAWAEATPREFRFCVKAPREVTHELGLPAGGSGAGREARVVPLHVREVAARFFELLHELEGKLGAVLLQFPPDFTSIGVGRLEGLLGIVPGGVRTAVELRHSSWNTPRTAGVLRGHGAAWVWADDAPEQWAARAPDEAGYRGPRARISEVTADFLYVRWMGKHHQFAERGGEEQVDTGARMRWWEARLREAAGGKGLATVWGFFNNDFSGHAPTTAWRFAEREGAAGMHEPLPRPRQPSLFGGV